MKFIKTFEVFFHKGVGKPKVGDYILCKLDPEKVKAPKIFFNFVNNNLGKVVDMMNNNIDIYDHETNSVISDNILYVVQWSNVPERDFKLKKEFIEDDSSFYWDGCSVKPGEFRENCLPIHEDEWIEFGETPEEIESKILATKFNI